MIVEAAAVNNFQAVVSNALISEYEDVIYRPEHRMPNWRDEDLYELVQSLLVPADWADVQYSYRPLLDDPADELVLEAAINGMADMIVTFNVRHFNEQARNFGIGVRKPGEFLRGLKEKGFQYGKK